MPRPQTRRTSPKLSVAERILLVQDLWDSIAADQAPIPMTRAQRAELERRLRTYRAAGSPGEPLPDVLARLRPSR